MEIIESKKHEGLSVAKIKRMKNYENVSDEQAQEILFAVKNLAAEKVGFEPSDPSLSLLHFRSS